MSRLAPGSDPFLSGSFVAPQENGSDPTRPQFTPLDKPRGIPCSSS